MQDDDLIAAFEQGGIDGADFPHERHVRVCWGLAQRYERGEALRRLIAGISAMAARAGRPEAYHETITRAWFELIAGAEDLRHSPELFDKTLLGRYYSPARLAAGRERWLEPDLHPLRLPAPALAPVPAPAPGLAPAPAPAPGLAPAPAPAPAPSSAGDDLPVVMRQIPTAVAVLATRLEHTVHASTVSSFTSVSRTPPLISVCLANGSRTLDLVRDARSFALSVLASDQGDLAARFAAAGRLTGAEQFDGVPHHLNGFGPVIENATAWIGCRLHAAHPCGDHHIVLGEVGLAQAPSGKHPLLRHDAAYH